MKLVLSSMIVMTAAAGLLAAGANLPFSESTAPTKATTSFSPAERAAMPMATAQSSARARVQDSDLSATLLDRAVEEAPSTGRTLTPELIDRCLEVADDVEAALAARLRALCVDDPAEFERVMQKVGRRFIGLAELKARDPALYRVKIKELQHESQVNRVAHQLAAAMESEDQSRVQELEAELRNLIRVQVAMSIKAQGDYLQRLKEHVRALEARIEREAANFDQTVENRLQELVQQSQQTAGVGGWVAPLREGKSNTDASSDALSNQPR